MRFATMVFRAAVTIHVVLLLMQPILIGLSPERRGQIQVARSRDRRERRLGHGLFACHRGDCGVAHRPLSARMVIWCLVLFVGETFQLMMGYDRHLGIHVPLGVLLAVMASFLYTWAYKPQATRASPPHL